MLYQTESSGTITAAHARELIAYARDIEPEAVTLPDDIDTCDHLITDKGEICAIDNHGRATTNDGTVWRMCEQCCEWHIADDGEYIADTWFCSCDCAHEYGLEVCTYCGEWFSLDSYDAPGYLYVEEHHHIHEGMYCSSECAIRDGWAQCANCCEWLHGEYLTTHDGDSICCNCADNYSYCEECEDYYPNNETQYIDGVTLCDSCAEHRGHKYLYEYGYTPRIRFFGDTRGNAVPYLGVELETDSGDDRYAYVSDLVDTLNADMYWLTKDSSLNDGVEVTSMPCTLEEHISSGLWKSVGECAREHGFVSHNSGNCGLHVHINRDFFGKNRKVQDAAAYKITRVLQRFERQFTLFARRENNRWCKYKTDANYDKPPMKPRGVLEKAEHLANNYGRDHSRALNMQHSATFEIRIFRGTLKTETLYASLALVQGLAIYTKTHGESSCEHVSWYDLMNAIIESTDDETARTSLVSYLTLKGLI